MSDTDIFFLKFIESYLNERMSGEVFSIAYIELWRIRRDQGHALKGSYDFGGCVDSIFIAADTYNPSSNRGEYEFDEEQLRNEVSRIITEYKN